VNPIALVGAGPGDPDLITVRGLRYLQRAEVIVYDRLGTEELIPLASPECELLDVGKEPGRHGMDQADICALLVELATTGRRVVRLKGGDPFVFGRGGEEALALAEAGATFEIVPGVSSALAGPAGAGIPVTHREIARSVTVVSGHDDPSEPAAADRWERLAGVPGTLVLLMAMRHLDRIAEAMIRAGRPADEPVAVVQWASTPRERRLVTRLGSVAERCAQEGLTNPAVVVVGPVVAVADRIAGAMAHTAPGARRSA